jgi:hypothetical protein
LDKNVYPICLDTYRQLLDKIGVPYQEDPEGERLLMFVPGSETRLLVHVGVGYRDGRPWLTRFLSYSVEFEPLKAGVEPDRLYSWLNDTNARVIFGRYYYEKSSDTVIFEVAVPGNGGILGTDFNEMLGIATDSVDRVHASLKALAPERAEAPKRPRRAKKAS